MKQLFRQWTFFVSFAFLAVPVMAQQTFDEWKAEQEHAFQQYKSEEDAAFARFLQEEWEAFQAHLGQDFFSELKLVEPPVADRHIAQGSGSLPPTKQPGVPPKKKKAADRAAPANFPSGSSPTGGTAGSGSTGSRGATGTTTETVRIEFHRVPVELAVPRAVFDLRLQSISSDGFAGFWETAHASGLAELTSQLKTVVGDRGLNDYGFFRLVLETTAALFDRERDRVAAAWFLMIKSGYGFRVAYGGSQVALLMPTRHMLYGVAYFRSGDDRFYLLDANGQAVRSQTAWRTHASDHPDARELLSLLLPAVMNLPVQVQTESLDFRYRRQQYDLNIPVNESLVDFMYEYPFTDWWVHFTPPASRQTRNALADQLGRLVRGRSNWEAANFLLRFVQTAFPYQTDQEQFGREKWQAPEEILYYRLSDCDDRSVMFSFLLTEVLGWDDVAILSYPGHLAVAISDRYLPADGDTVSAGGRRYIVADPTYIGADVGMAMPQFVNAVPEVLRLQDVEGLMREM